MRSAAVEPQVQGQLGQLLVTLGNGAQQPVQQALDEEEEALHVGLRRVEVVLRGKRIRDPQRLQRHLQIVGGQPVQALRLGTEAAAQPGGRQLQEGAHRADAELPQAGAERRVDAQPIQRRLPRQHPLPGRIPDHRRPLAGRDGLGDRIGAEPREADDSRCLQSARAERRGDLVRPLAERCIQVRQPGGVQPEDPRLVPAGLDAGTETAQPGESVRRALLDLPGRHLAGVQRARQRQAGGVAHPPADAGRARRLVHPEDDALRLVAIDHRHRPVGPAGMALQEELEREGRQLNARHPVHDTTPRRSIPDRAACP